MSTNARPVLTVQLSSTTGGGFGAVTGAATARAVCGGVDRVAATDTVSNRSTYLANPERRRQATASNQRRYARSARTRPTARSAGGPPLALAAATACHGVKNSSQSTRASNSSTRLRSTLAAAGAKAQMASSNT